MSFHAAFVFICALVFSCHLRASDEISTSELQAFAQSAVWSKLFYPDNSGLSRADAPAFFVSAARTPLAELQEALQRLEREPLPPEEKSFVCNFPLRTKRIAEAFGGRIPKLRLAAAAVDDPAQCPKLHQWQERVRVKSASLIFSSYYLGNPSSTFGHTFLRLNRTENPGTKDLLDQGINFGANATTDNPVVYAVGGMFGYFPSSFIALPYYYKVREYNDYEARDLWEYHLNLTVNEVQDLVLALWEQKDNHYDYYFLTENCGYYMLALVEAAAPRFEMTSRLRRWVIPADTLVIGERAGLFKSSNYRPSLKTQLDYRVGGLSAKEVELYESSAREIRQVKVQNPEQADEAIAHLAVFSSHRPVSEARVVDALMDDFDIHNKQLYLEDIQKPLSSEAMVKRALLFKRSELPPSQPMDISAPQERDPIRTHGSFRWGIGVQHAHYRDGEADYNSFLLPVRMAYHDLLDPSPGAPEGASIEIFKFLFSAGEARNIWHFDVENFEPVHLLSMPYLKRAEWRPSWEVRVGADRVTDRFAHRELRPVLDLAYGWGPFLMRGAYEYSPSFAEDDYLLKAGPAFVFSKELRPQWATLVDFDLPLFAGNTRQRDVAHELYRFRWLNRWHIDLKHSLELGLEARDLESKLFLNYYVLQF